MGEEPYLLAAESPRLGDPSPILLPILSDTRHGEKSAGRRLRIGQSPDEDWVGRDLSLWAPLTGMAAGMSVTDYHGLVGGAINRVFVRARRKTRWQRAEVPFDHFLLEHAERRRMGDLPTALEY